MSGKIYWETLLLVALGCAIKRVWAEQYVVQPGDTLSAVAHTRISGRLYGRDGALEKLIALNPLKRQDPDLIHPNEILEISPTTVLSSADQSIGFRAPALETLEKNEPTISTPSAIPNKINGEHSILSGGFELQPAFISIQQSGVFGAANGSAVTIGTAFHAAATFDNWKFRTSWSSYSLNLRGDLNTPSTGSEIGKSFQTYTIDGGYGPVFLGVKAEGSPLLSSTGTGGTLQWEELTTLSPTLGLHFQKTLNENTPKPSVISLDLKGAIPVAASTSNGDVSISHLKGYQVGVELSDEKTVYSNDSLSMNVGFRVGAEYLHQSYFGAWNGEAGQVSQGLRRYWSSLLIRIDL